MNEEKDDRNVDEHARARTPPPPEGRGSSLLRGCGIALERMDKLGQDPVLPVLGESPDLEQVLIKLSQMLGS